uniref:Uncharacterized protein n=1 Tax=Picea sitchensis TaxID=3332 RepID=D5A9C5_PICSI|nr:unknown [Picea sitchensis]
MTSNKDEAAQAATDRIKAAALSAAKGFSRSQAERAAAAAARNVNAYGQKEEGPSRWQERKEAKRQMYLKSTEKAVKLGVRKDSKPTALSGSAAQQCQKCFQTGHWTHECKNERVYTSRPSRTQQLKNPKLKMKISVSYELGKTDNPQNILGSRHGRSELSTSLKLDMNYKIKSKSKNKSQKKKTKRKGDSDESIDGGMSEASVFSSSSDIFFEGSDSETGTSASESGSSGTSSESDSEEERRSSKKHRKRRHRRYSSSESDSSSSSESGSGFDSDSEDGRKRRRKHQRRHHARR